MSDAAQDQSALASLPHGPEFRFLTRLMDLVPGKSGRAEYFLDPELPFLRGHFPGQPILPGVIMIEALAQLAGVVAQSDPALPPMSHLRLAAVRSAKITGTIPPGNWIIIEASISGRMGNLLLAEGKVTDGHGNALLTAQVTLSGNGEQAEKRGGD